MSKHHSLVEFADTECSAQCNNGRMFVCGATGISGILFVPESQVAGHRAEGEKPGPLANQKGKFYKPLQDDERGSLEVSFYKKFWSSEKIPQHIQKFFPRFYGTTFLKASDGTAEHEYAVIEDAGYKFRHPSVIDIKIGSRTWYPGATEEYIKKCLSKDKETTSLHLGFRISGMQVYDIAEKAIWKAEKDWCKSLTPDGAQKALVQFFSLNPLELTVNGWLASLNYGVAKHVLSQLLELKLWFENQTLFHFNSASLLLFYESDSFCRSNETYDGDSVADDQISVKLIDFAHVIDGQNIIDHNFLGGLCSLIHVVSKIVDSSRAMICDHP